MRGHQHLHPFGDSVAERIEVDANAPQLSPHCLTHPASERGRASLAETGGWREVGKRRSKPVDPATLMVEGDERDALREQTVKLTAQRSKRVRVAIVPAEEDDSARA